MSQLSQDPLQNTTTILLLDDILLKKTEHDNK